MATSDDGPGEARAKKLESTLKALDVMELKVVDSPPSEGALLYILFKVSAAFASQAEGSTSFDLCLDCDGSDDNKASHKWWPMSRIAQAQGLRLRPRQTCCQVVQVGLDSSPFASSPYFLHAPLWSQKVARRCACWRSKLRKGRCVIYQVAQ